MVLFFTSTGEKCQYCTITFPYLHCSCEPPSDPLYGSGQGGKWGRRLLIVNRSNTTHDHPSGRRGSYQICTTQRYLVPRRQAFFSPCLHPNAWNDVLWSNARSVAHRLCSTRQGKFNRRWACYIICPNINLLMIFDEGNKKDNLTIIFTPASNLKVFLSQICSRWPTHLTFNSKENRGYGRWWSIVPQSQDCQHFHDCSAFYLPNSELGQTR